ncbi:MAG: hypothetical protein Q8R37_01410 [Nanoarchaeota archaeon]|nr:hypothetical protein [Nanoarchaeota archaeon]
MNRKDLLTLIGLGFVLILVINLVLFALRIIKTVLFWVIIILAAVFVYKLLPLIKKKLTK